MSTEIKVPTFGESVTEATVARWLKQVGDPVKVDDPLVELETDKVTLEVNASAAGTLSEIAAAEGSNVQVGGVLGLIGEGAATAPAKPSAPASRQPRRRRSRLRSVPRRRPPPRLRSRVPVRPCASWSKRPGSIRRPCRRQAGTAA